MHHFCTLFDSGYLLRGLTLYRSLCKKDEKFRLYILCLDEVAYKIVSVIDIDNIIPINLKEIEEWDCDLIEVKKNRQKVEYYFTLSPLLPLYILRTINNVDIITYLDADLFFFNSPDVLYKEMNNNSTLIIEHDYSRDVEEKYSGHGKYNVEYLSFRNDKEGIACLERWGEQCKNWCFDRVENGLYADQAYLNEWPTLYKNLVISKNKGAGLAPWNCNKYKFKINNSEIYVNEDKLVFFHFHGIKILSNCFISQNLRSYGAKLSSDIKARLYRKYISEIKETYKWLKSNGISGISFTDKVISRRTKLTSNRTLIDRLINLISSLYFVC